MSEAGVDAMAGSLDETTCEELAADAVRISGEDTGFGVELLKVREPRIVEDNRDSYGIPTGSDEELILACRGGGVWDNSSTDDVRIELTVDADGESWVAFRAMS